MQKKQISSGQRAWLETELSRWSAAGLVDVSQVERIRTSYETVADTGDRKRALARLVLQGLSAFLVGLAVLLLIGYNWDKLHWLLKLALIFGGVLGTHTLGIWLRIKNPGSSGAEVVILLGCLLYGAGIWLVAQIFHLDSHYPDGVWWWAIGVLPFALALDTLLLHVLLVGLLALWAGMEILNFPHLGPWWFYGWVPNGAYSLVLLAAPGIVWAYRRGSAAALGLYVPLIAWWIILQAFAWRLGSESVFIIGSLGAIFLIVAENHRHMSSLARPYRVCGNLLVAGALIPLSFHDFIEHLNSRADESSWAVLVETVAVAVMLAAAAAFSFLLQPLDSAAGHDSLGRLKQLAARQWMPLAIVFLMLAVILTSVGPAGGPVVATVLANLGMIAFAIWMMHVGLREEDGRTFSFGVAYFLLWSILRYVDLFGKFAGMLGAAGMFFVCGALLFGLATLWGRRKELGRA